jgi:hypothetical protein
MSRVFSYYNRFQGFRGSLVGLPPWARIVLLIAALPGIAAVVLSIAALLVSLCALLVVTVPVYRLLVAITGNGEPRPGGEAPDFVEDPGFGRPDAKRIDATVRDTPPDESSQRNERQ